ncbi:MAG: CARDB domain-containing protein [Thermoproteota archaeon]
MRRGKLFLVLLMILQLVFLLIVTSDVNDSEINLDELTIVAVHPFNWIEWNRQHFWDTIVEQLHMEFLDRATGFMEWRHWHEPDVDGLTIAYARRKGVVTGSYMVLTPIPPSPEPMYTDPYGNTKPFRQVAGGTDLNGVVLFHPDNLHITVSVSCPQWEEHFIRSAEKILDKGLNAIDVDCISVPPFAFGGDFSEWSVYKFRNYLASRFTREELANLGVRDVDKFDIRNYVKQRLDASRIAADILVIAAPKTSFSPEEVEAIKSYVKNGGGLLLQIEPDGCHVANGLSKEFGVTVKCGNLVSSSHLWDYGSFEVYAINRDHEVTRGVASLTWNWGVALEVNNPSAVILAQTDEKSWVDSNNNLLIDSNEERGPFPVIVGLEYGKGRVIIHGDRTQDSIFDSYGVFLRNALLWLGKGVLNRKTLMFDELHWEEATLSSERACAMNAQHPEWYLYSRFSELATGLGLNVTSTGMPPSFPQDRVLREYVKFLHMELVRFINNFVERVKEYGRNEYGKNIPVYGNQWLGTLYDDNFLRDIALDSILLSPYLDIIQIEVVPSTFPPRNRLTLTYRFGHAMAQSSKPVWNQGAFYSDLGYRELSHKKVNLTILGIAEAYANGAIKELDLAGWPGVPAIAGTVVLPNMSIPKNVQELLDFIWVNRRLLVGFKPYSKIALVYSVPSFLWNTFPAFNIYPEEQRRELTGLADMLQRLHFPYDIIILGHPDLMDDTYYLDRLKNYDAIIFPDVSDISAIQIEAVENFVKNGGKIIFTGNIPIYDQDHNHLAQEKQSRLNRIILEHTDQVVLIRDLLGCEWYENMIRGYTEEEKYNSTLNKFKSLLNSLIEKPLVITNSLPESVEVNILKKDNTVSIHFINYQYLLETDEFLKTNSTQISIDATIVGKIDNIAFLSPETMEQLKFNYDGRYVNITLPSLNYWGFVVINMPETSPSEFEVSNLNVNPDTIKVGQAALISVSVKNNGGETGSCVLTLKVNGLVVDTRTVKLNPGQSTTVSFSYTPEKEGIYSIDVNGLTGNLTVSEEESEGETPSLVPETILLAIGVVVIITMALVGLFFRRKTRRRPP